MRKLGALYIVLLCFLAACTESTEVVLDNPGVNGWMYSVMSDNYLWASQLPPVSKTDVGIKPHAYFEEYLRYRVDRNVPYSKDRYGDRFSRLTEVALSRTSYEPMFSSNEKVNDFGIGIRTFESGSDNDKKVHYVQVIHVAAKSPADIAGIKRGDMFNVINGLRMPENKGAVVYELGQGQITISIYYPKKREVTLAKAYYFDSPVLFDSIYDTSPKTGYVVYNHFSTGESSRYLNELNAVFFKFKQAGVRDLIIDMRYNAGGELTVARHVASLIVRNDLLGQPLVYKETKGSFGKKELFSLESFMSKTSAVSAYNIDAQRVYIICSSNTASASELLMHALKPYYLDNMKIIGQTTKGKNLGSIEITNSRYCWKINPITIRVYNCNKVSQYEQGIRSDIQLAEVDTNIGRENIGAFGDTSNEIMIRMALWALHPEYVSAPDVRSYDARTRQSEPLTTSTYVPDRGLIVDRVFE